MQYLATILSLLSAAPLALAACANSPPGSVPYHVTSFSGHSPSGRPGNSPAIYNNMTFTDPNTCETFRCYAEWTSADTTGSPFLGFVPCSAEVSEVEFWRPDNGQNRVVQIRHSWTTVEDGTTATWTATANGTVPYQTNCGGSGVCNYGMAAGASADLPIIEIHAVA